ncbi:MAG TPA: hypothetical protein VIG08_17060 [Gemmatimonadales bacterium]
MSAPPLAGHFFDSETEVLDLVREFEACTLPRSRWDHRAHLTVALWYASALEPDDALDRVRRGIHRLNEACGVVSTPTSGYHETITRFYMRVVGDFVRREAEGDWAIRANRLIERYGERKLPLRYYTESRLMSPAARAEWVEPDLAPLP